MNDLIEISNNIKDLKSSVRVLSWWRKCGFSFSASSKSAILRELDFIEQFASEIRKILSYSHLSS